MARSFDDSAQAKRKDKAQLSLVLFYAGDCWCSDRIEAQRFAIYQTWPNDEIRDRINPVLQNDRAVSISTFGLDAYIAAYTGGEEYIDQLVRYLEGNIRYLDGVLKAHMPKIRLIQPEGTYLMWLDCRGLGLDSERLDGFFTNEAEVGLDKGFWFGEEGNGFMRMNAACPRSTVEEALRRIQCVYHTRFPHEAREEKHKPI